jgi:dihydroflavonol-4-reductase
MADVLITGATGTVGHPIAERLAAAGDRVRALVRSAERARTLLPEGVEPVAGDVADAASVREATVGCAVVYHAAGLPEQWRRDPADFQRVNVEGTRNAVEAALAEGVERFAYTSTIDVFRWTPGEPYDESELDPDPQPTHYERSKQEADRIVTAALDRGLPAVFLHPSAVYGPSPVLTGLNDVLARVARRELPALLPGGMPVVYGDDVAEGHLRAAVQAPVGSRYILSDRFFTLTEMAQAVRRQAPDAKVPRELLLPLARAAAVVGERVAAVTGRPPLIPRGGLEFLVSGRRPIADRARSELGWTPTPFDEGLARTFAHFRERGWVER